MAKRILVVDDDPDFLLSTAHALRDAGYVVVGAGGGQEAMRTIEQDESFDLFVIDAMMSSFTEGFELVHELRRRNETRHTPILMLTAIEEEFGGRFELESDTETLLLNGLLRKPVTPDELVQKVQQLIGQ